MSQEDVDSSMQLWLEKELLRAKKLRGGSEKAEKKEEAEEEAVNLFVAMSLTKKEAYTFFAVGFMKADRCVFFFFTLNADAKEEFSNCGGLMSMNLKIITGMPLWGK